MLQSQGFPDTRPSLLATLGAEGGPRQSAWREFFERYAPAVFRVGRLRGLDEADADDVVQQVMLAVSTHIGGFSYDRDRGKFRQWVRRIAESKIADHFRASRRTTQPSELLDTQPDDRPTPEEAWEQEWRLQDMLYCLDLVADDISPRRMQAFKMYVLEGQPTTEIAQHLGMTPGYVYVTRYHVLGMVRRRMEELEEGNSQA